MSTTITDLAETREGRVYGLAEKGVRYDKVRVSIARQAFGNTRSGDYHIEVLRPSGWIALATVTHDRSGGVIATDFGALRIAGAILDFPADMKMEG